MIQLPWLHASCVAESQLFLPISAETAHHGHRQADHPRHRIKPHSRDHIEEQHHHAVKMIPPCLFRLEDQLHNAPLPDGAATALAKLDELLIGSGGVASGKG